jgi:hypothetical protein
MTTGDAGGPARRTPDVTRAVTMIALALLAAACGGANARTQPRAGAAPLHFPGGYTCPGPDPILGFHRRFYPVGFPDPPPMTVRPDRCFASTTQAAGGGYTRAPVPAGDIVIRDVYLVPPARSLAAACRRSVGTAKLVVPCPTLVPADPRSVACNGYSACAGPGWFVLEGHFTGPPGYVGAPAGGGGHLYVIAFTRRSGAWPKDTLTGGHVVGRTHLHGRTAVYHAYPFGTGLNSGHVALVWHIGGETYAVSLHGQTDTNARLDRAIAAHLHLLRR